MILRYLLIHWRKTIELYNLHNIMIISIMLSYRVQCVKLSVFTSCPLIGLNIDKNYLDGNRNFVTEYTLYSILHWILNTEYRHINLSS